jgi:hypothetical protein
MVGSSVAVTIVLVSTESWTWDGVFALNIRPLVYSLIILASAFLPSSRRSSGKLGTFVIVARIMGSL